MICFKINFALWTFFTPCVTLWVFWIWCSFIHKHRTDVSCFLLETKDPLNRNGSTPFKMRRGILILALPELQTSCIL